MLCARIEHVAADWNFIVCLTALRIIDIVRADGPTRSERVLSLQ
jgi:hypothetical protein